jgi:hypothetical protein
MEVRLGKKKDNQNWYHHKDNVLHIGLDFRRLIMYKITFNNIFTRLQENLADSVIRVSIL